MILLVRAFEADNFLLKVNLHSLATYDTAFAPSTCNKSRV